MDNPTERQRAVRDSELTGKGYMYEGKRLDPLKVQVITHRPKPEDSDLIKIEPEDWKDVPGFEGAYMVSRNGEIRSHSRIRSGKHGKIYQMEGRTILPSKTNRGYKCVSLSLDGETKTELVHRIVSSAFIPNPGLKPCVNHKNGNKADNRASNLEWVTYQENMSHAMKNGMYNSQKAVIQYSKTGEELKRFVSISDAARKTGEPISTIKNSLHGKAKNPRKFIWKYDTSTPV